MTDRPILFSAPMIRALLAGQKTQTRRILDAACDNAPAFIRDGAVMAFDCDENLYRWPKTAAVGDRLWVREAHFAYGHWVTTKERTRYGKPKRKFIRDFLTPVRFHMPESELQNAAIDHVEGWYKRSSLFMHREDSRITLPVTDVRIETLPDISEDDSIAEGIYEENVIVGANCNSGVHNEVTEDLFVYDGSDEHFSAASEAYAHLWDSINGDREGCAWKDDPWVVAYTFSVQHCNIDELDRAL